jgi:hypothetical protein
MLLEKHRIPFLPIVMAPNTMFNAVLGVCAIMNSFCRIILLYIQAGGYL